MFVVQSTTPFGKKFNGFIEGIGEEKYERVARESLRILLTFGKKLESEMQRIMDGVKKGMPLDHDLFDKMVAAKETHKEAVRGLKEDTEEQASHALIIFADAVQDLMAYLYKYWKKWFGQVSDDLLAHLRNTWSVAQNVGNNKSLLARAMESARKYTAEQLLAHGRSF